MADAITLRKELASGIFSFFISIIFLVSSLLVVTEGAFSAEENQRSPTKMAARLYRNVSSVHDDPASDGFLKP